MSEEYQYVTQEWSVEEVEQLNPCREELHQLAYLAMKKGYEYTTLIEEEDFIDIVTEMDEIDWCVEHGILKKKVERNDLNDYFFNLNVNRQELEFIISLLNIEDNDKLVELAERNMIEDAESKSFEGVGIDDLWKRFRKFL